MLVWYVSNSGNVAMVTVVMLVIQVANIRNSSTVGKLVHIGNLYSDNTGNPILVIVVRLVISNDV